jgi:hypothetical protein
MTDYSRVPEPLDVTLEEPLEPQERIANALEAISNELGRIADHLEGQGGRVADTHFT